MPADKSLKSQLLTKLSNTVVPLDETIEELGELSKELHVSLWTAEKMIEAIKREEAKGGKNAATAGFDHLIDGIQEALCDKDGNLIFAEEDKPLIQKWGFKVIRQLSARISELNGLSPSAEEKKVD